MRCLEEQCFLKIVNSPNDSLTLATVDRALFSERAKTLIRRSKEMKMGRSKGIDTVRLRQRIITKLIDEGKGMPGSFPAPPSFLDDSFNIMSLANSKVGDAFIQETLSKRCPMLRSVDLTACFYIRDGSMEALLQRCPHIERLSLRNCRKLTDLSMEYVVRHGKKIVALDVGGCFNLTAAGVDSLCTVHPNTATFTELDVSGIAVTTHTLELICKHCRNIRALRVGFIEYMEATLTHTLAPLAPRLRSLHVHWNTCITDEFLAWAVKSMPQLQDMNLCGCSQISVDGVSDMLYERKEALTNGAAGPLSPIKKVNVRYTAISKLDIEALQGAFEGVEFR